MKSPKNKPLVLFHPYIPKSAIKAITATLSTRWIGQGPKVDLFEKKFGLRFAGGRPSIAVGSGTDALHLSYILASLKPGDEVITPVFTCTATNIPLLQMGVKVVFADIQENTFNIDPEHVKKLINKKTKAIVCVHYAGLPCDMNELQTIADKWNIPIIEDAAQALGATYNGKLIGSISDFTTFSFQAIKHLPAPDSGMLTIKNKLLAEKAKRIRWFGIDRKAKLISEWENDIKEMGYKYQMTDISAAMGLAGLEEFEKNLAYRKKLLSLYEHELADIPGLNVIGSGLKDREHAAWICTIAVNNRQALQRKLKRNGIESDPVHYRNDRYSIFGQRRNNLPVMDRMEDKYLVLPLHPLVTTSDVKRICEIIRLGW